MAKLKKGDQVTWTTSRGKSTTGTVVKKLKAHNGAGSRGGRLETGSAVPRPQRQVRRKDSTQALDTQESEETVT